MRQSSILTAALVLAAAATAQRGIGAPLTNSSWGGSSLPVQTLASNGFSYSVDGNLGVTYDQTTGHTFVSARGDTSATGSPNYIFEYDKAGVYVRAYAQPAPMTAQNSWGIRDMAVYVSPLTGVEMWGGADGNKVYKFLPGVGFTGKEVSLSGYTGSQVRALAIAEMNNGQSIEPTFVVTNWSDRIGYYEVATGASLKASTPSIAPNVYGMAWDKDSDTIWVYGQGGSQRSTTDQCVLTQMDSAGVKTGQSFIVDGGWAGGLEFFNEGNGSEMLAMSQGATDEIFRMHGRFDYGPPCNVGEINFSGQPFEGQSNFEFKLSNAPAGITQAIPWIGAPTAVGLTLPGITNCELLLDLFVGAFPQPPEPITGGAASIKVPIPTSAGLVGAEIAFQWIMPQPSTVVPIDLSKAGAIYIQGQ